MTGSILRIAFPSPENAATSSPLVQPLTPQNLVLIGFMGSGKSTVGRLVARNLGISFVDTDQLIVDRCGKSISEIFAKEGEDVFRDHETCVIRSLAQDESRVIATGGGAVVRTQNREMLRRTGFVVYLHASEDVLFERVSRNTKRPLLQCENPRQTLHRLLESRKEAYESTAHWMLDTSELPLSEAVDRLAHATREHFAWNPPSSKFV